MEEIFYKSNPWWEDEYNFNGVSRNTYLEKLDSVFENKDIIFLTGLRRVGKTSILKNFISLLIHKKNIKPQYIFYITLDLIALSSMTINEILKEYKKIHLIPSSQKVYIFLDKCLAKINVIF